MGIYVANIVNKMASYPGPQNSQKPYIVWSLGPKASIYESFPRVILVTYTKSDKPSENPDRSLKGTLIDLYYGNLS